MPLSVMIVDYKLDRRDFMRDAVKFGFKDATFDLVTATERDGDRPQDYDEAARLSQKEADLVVYNTKSNPSPKLFIEEFKKKSPKSRVFLYRDMETIRVSDFNEYRLADGMATVMDADMADAEKAKKIADAIKVTVGESPAVKLAWLKNLPEAVTKVVTVVEGFSKIATALIAIGTLVAGLVGGYLVSESGIWV